MTTYSPIAKGQLALLVESYEDTIASLIITYCEKQKSALVKSAWTYEELIDLYNLFQNAWLTMNNLDHDWFDLYVQFKGCPQMNILTNVEMHVTTWAPKNSG